MSFDLKQFFLTLEIKKVKEAFIKIFFLEFSKVHRIMLHGYTPSLMSSNY
jgi:hypothetical protein